MVGRHPRRRQSRPLGSRVRTAAYLAKQRTNGKTKTEAIRCLKRHLYHLLDDPTTIPITGLLYTGAIGELRILPEARSAAATLPHVVQSSSRFSANERLELPHQPCVFAETFGYTADRRRGSSAGDSIQGGNCERRFDGSPPTSPVRA